MKILTHYLLATKGKDIRMLYNGTLSGLNDTLWDPQFTLTKVRIMLRATEVGTYMADMDTDEIFLNFTLSKDVRPYCRVNISNMRTEEEWERGILGGWERWERKMMGITDSP